MLKELNYKGEVYSPADPEFEQIAYGGLFNKLHPNRLPQLILRVANEEDVVAAVKYARANKLKVAVRGGGHNWCAPSLRNSGVMIDLTNLNQVISIDEKNMKAVLQPIISNRDAMAALNAKGVAYPTGHCPPVKLSGYLLSGGMAWNQGVWGTGCGSLEAIDMVTASGEKITASATEHQDYFWAARGAGPGMFAVCTRYHLKVYPLPKAIAACAYWYPYENLTDIARWIEPLASKLPNFVELSFWAVPAPPELAEQFKVSNGKAALVTASIFADTMDDAKRAAAPLDECPIISKCVKKTGVTPSSFPELFDASGALWPDNLYNKVDAQFSNGPLAALVNEDISRHFLKAPPKAVYMFALFTGKGSPVAENASFSMYASIYGGPWTMWDDGQDNETNIAWHEKMVQLMSPVVVGHYVAESDTVTHPEYVDKAYKAESLKRLGELRKQYDPDGVFFSYSDGLD